MPIPPPVTAQQLLDRARALGGLTVAEAAARCGWETPPDLRRHKGWLGELVEELLGASAASLPQPDFPDLGIELKTLPIDRRGRPRESTYVCTVPLDRAAGRWEDSWVRRKLSRVLWFPVEAEPDIPLGRRRLGSALLWQPSAEQEALLRQDWEELMELVCTGGLEQITARMGQVLQIRPKAAHARIRRQAIGEDGTGVRTNPRGFYLRPAFTRAILERHYLVSAG